MNYKILRENICIKTAFLFSAMFAIIGMSIYTAKYKMKPGYEYGWSYILGWFGTGFTVVSGILCFFADVDYEPVRWLVQ